MRTLDMFEVWVVGAVWVDVREGAFIWRFLALLVLNVTFACALVRDTPGEAYFADGSHESSAIPLFTIFRSVLAYPWVFFFLFLF